MQMFYLATTSSCYYAKIDKYKMLGTQSNLETRTQDFVRSLPLIRYQVCKVTIKINDKLMQTTINSETNSQWWSRNGAGMSELGELRIFIYFSGHGFIRVIPWSLKRN